MELPTIERLLPRILNGLQALADDIAVAREVVAGEAAKVEPFVGKEEAARFLNFSTKTLERRMREIDGPPRYTDGGKVSFLRSELRAWRRQWKAGDQTGIEP